MSFMRHDFFGGNSPKKATKHILVGRVFDEIAGYCMMLLCGLTVGMLILIDKTYIQNYAIQAASSMAMGCFSVLASLSAHNKKTEKFFGFAAMVALASTLIFMVLIGLEYA